MTIKILAVADQVSPALYDRFDPERWRDVDMVVSCGDLPPGYLDVLATRLAVPVLYVRGNHDARFAPDEYDGATDLDGHIMTVEGVRIAGFAGSMCYNAGGYQFTERQMRHRFQRMRLRALRLGSPDVIVTHAPPADLHDGDDVCHRGFQAFRQAIDVWHPRLLLHGHMHAYSGRQSDLVIGSTQVINVFPFRLLDIPEPADAALSNRGLETSPDPAPLTDAKKSPGPV